MTDTTPGGFLTLGDLEAAAAAKVERDVWEFVQGGAGDEMTLRANRDAFHRQTLRPRVLAGTERIDLRSTVLGAGVAAPFFVAPTAYQGLLAPDGEVATARAARDAGLLTVVSTLSTRSLEEIAAAAPDGLRWFQLYLQPEFSASVRLVERAEKAGYRYVRCGARCRISPKGT